jgi:uncharacterized repeat protein (TIGR01451 family)
MKMRVHPSSLNAILGALGAITGLLLVASAPAQVRPTHRPDLPNFDRRAAVAPAVERNTERERGKSHLAEQLPSAAVDFDPLLDAPKFVRAADGFLTGPVGQGRAVSEQTAKALSANDPLLPIKGFLNEHRELFGYGAEALAGARVKRDYVDSRNGLRTVVWEQQLDGIPLFESVLVGNITRKGELASLSSVFLPGLAAAADVGTPGRATLQAAPPVTAIQAVALAAQNLGMNLTPNEIIAVDGLVGEGNYSVFKTPEDAYVRLVWLPENRSSLRLGWEVMVTSHATKERFRLVIDAQSGAAQLRENLSCYISDASYNIYPSDSPSPFSPGLQVPGNFQPSLTNRVMITTPALDTIASPEGWIPDGTNTTTGNNIDAFVDRNFNQQPDQPRPVGNPSRVFDFPLDLTLDPTNYIDASTVQLFWRANWYHDRLYELGFTEAAGNYQENNFGRGGIGGDRIICYVQAGADVGLVDNSMFQPAPDGISGQCYMFVFTGPSPARDGSLDSEVVCHELTHGTSWRLVGGGMTLGSLQGNGMGEGWSDFYALCLLGEPTDDPNAAYPMAGYVTYQYAGTGMTQNYYYGFRHFPYCTNMRKNPFTFKDIDPSQISPHAGVPRSPLYPFFPQEADEVHHQGEVWCSALWEVHANLVAKYGWTNGNEMMLQLATDGMKLTPPAPNFLQARDAILLADVIDNGGANTLDIWKGFAKRGMGFSARSPAGSTTAGVVEAFDLPGLSVDHAVVSGGNGNGVIDFDECNMLQIFVANNAGFPVTNVTARLSSSTPGVIIVGPLQPYPDLPDGATNANVTPFRISTSPSFVCGTPIICTLVVKSDQVTSTNQFTIPSGMPGVPLRFDNSIPAPIPDVGETNSAVVVSNITSGINKVTVGLYITHTYDSDLLLQLIGPDGTTTTLSANNGGSGDNYGGGCSPDSLRTVFDDAATNSITAGFPPFIGSFQPQTPLSVFIGKSGTNVNGTWRLRAVDQAALDVGTIQCWSLFITPALCTDGGGECPGADLALGMIGQPNPVVLGQYLTYVIGVTNNGPSSAKNTLVTHQLPSSVIFVSATTSQGTVAQAGGLVTGNLGTLGIGGTATITVVVIPTVQGTISSTASVTSSQTDPDSSNNNATVLTQVSPATADLAVGLAAAPNPVVIGATLTYTVSVTNNGPSDASGVTVTNTLPASLAVLSATVSQGSITTGGGSWTIGTLPSGARATATITAVPTAEGSFVGTSTVQGNQVDSVPVNNTATLTIVVGPSTDLAIGITDFPDPVVVSSNVTYVVSITNLGPSAATGVSVNQFLPPGVPIVSTNPSQGVVSIAGSTVSWTVGALNSSAKATLTIVLTATTNGMLTTSASVAGDQPDANLANNSASATTSVALPGVAIVAAGATLTAESFTPPNGAIDIGETVTIILRLRNSSNVSTLSLVGTLQTNNGVVPIPPNSPQNFGVLTPSGPAVGRPFSFIATGTNGQTINPTLQLRDGATTYPPVTFSFTLPNVRTFTNTNAIAIRDKTNALPYPSTLLVSGLSGTVGKVTATLNDLSHGYVPDIDVLLVSPGGQDTILMSAAGGASSATNATMTFDDAAAIPVPSDGPIYSGTFQPGNYLGDNLPGPAPAGPYPAAMSMFNGANPNGQWALYVADHTAGDTGSIAGGWGLTFTTITPVNQLADLALTAQHSPDPVLAGSPLTYTYSIANLGPSSATSVAFTNSLPAGVNLVSATSSQGQVITNSTAVLANLGNLSTGAVATVTVVVIPTPAVFPPGLNSATLTAAATVGASETDPNPANNAISVPANVQRPVADVGLGLVVRPNPGAASFPLTNTIVVTNNGPGTALAIVVTNPLPPGAALVSATSTVGSCVNVGGVVTCSLGDLASNATATIQIVSIPSLVGLYTNIASATTASLDTNPNNTAVIILPINNPAPQIINAGAVLTYESGPVNGLIDPGETVTVAFSLANVGSLDTVNLKAALKASGGVLSPSGLQAYGVLIREGPSVSRNFTFTSGAAAGGVIVATLELQDERPGVTNLLGQVTFTFNPPVKSHWVNTNAITIPDHGPGIAYPSQINVSGAGGLVTKATLTLNGFRHSFPHDVNVLLVSPSGNNVLLMSHTGGGYSVTNLTLSFDDAAANSLPNNDVLTSGTNKPSSYPGKVVFPTPAPQGNYGTGLSTVNGGNPNGPWLLYVFDDAVGDAGAISGGWTLDLTTATTLRPLADLAIGMTSAPSSLFVGATFTNTIWVTNFGPSVATGVIVTNWLSTGEQAVANIGNLAPNAATKVTLVMAPGLAGNIANMVSVIGNEADLNPLNNSAQSIVAVTAPAIAVLDASMVGGQLHITISAQPGFNYAILASTNLTSWISISTNTASPAGTIKFTDTNSPNFVRRYYRTIRLIP